MAFITPERPFCAARFHQILSYGVFVVVVSVILTSPAMAQGRRSRDKEKIPEPEDVLLTTKDGVKLKATYFAGTEGKQAVPVVLLHMYKGNGGDYRELALGLQKLGHAVIVPDLRGHGASTDRAGASKPLKAERLGRRDFIAMVTQDMEAVKKFLIEKNNAGELNIEKLCIVGAEMGANVALDWARLDWSWPVLGTGKQGQDVKALVLISPDQNFKGLSVQPALASPAIRRLAMMIIVGAGERGPKADATRLNNALERYHPEPPKEEWAEKKDFWFFPLKTKLQGTKMLEVADLAVGARIAKFIEWRLVNQTFPWKERKQAF